MYDNFKTLMLLDAQLLINVKCGTLSNLIHKKIIDKDYCKSHKNTIENTV